MKVAIDTSCLILMLDPSANRPIDPSTGNVLDDGKERIEYLIENLSRSGTKVVVPAMVLAEILARAKAEAPKYLSALEGSPAIQIHSFDRRAAVELAALDLRVYGKLAATAESPRQKVKVDRQIVAVSKVNGVDLIYSDDTDLRKFAVKAGLEAKASWDLPAKPKSKQRHFDFD